jgi:hypothetical protein
MVRWRWLAWSVLALTAAPAVAAQASKWRLLETQDELTGAQDRRLILRAEGWTAGGATLILACGDRLPGIEGRTLLLNAAEPLHPFGGAGTAYAEVAFDTSRTRERHYWRMLDGAGAQVVFVGDEANPVFSEPLFARLLGANIVEVRCRVLGGDRVIRFELRGLREELRHLSACRWPGLS